MFESSVIRTASTVFKDNMGALTLTNVPKLTPWSKHIAIPYHFFPDFIWRKEVEVVHVETDNQLVDMLTNGLVQVKFESLREKLMGLTYCYALFAIGPDHSEWHDDVVMSLVWSFGRIWFSWFC